MSNRRYTFHLTLAAAGLGLLLSGCLTPIDSTPTDTLDETTGNTYTSVAQPLVFARRRADVAANARDYATIAAAHINRAGKITTFMLVYRWATVDMRMSALPLQSQGRLSFLADGRSIELQPATDPQAAAMLRSQLAAPRAAAKVGWVYAVDGATLQYLAESRELQLQFPDEALTQVFDVFEDGRQALRAFALQTGP
jgi:hypothetical protein